MSNSQNIGCQVNILGPGPYRRFYDLGSNWKIGCKNETKLCEREPKVQGDGNQGRSKNWRRTLKIFWEDWYAREISRFVCNKVQLF